MQKVRNCFKGKLALLLVCALTAGMLSVGSKTTAAVAEAATSEANTARSGYGLNNPSTDGNGVTTWDCVWFGSYPQSDATGAAKEPIKWRVLSVNGDDVFLLADTNLDVQKYNDTYTSVTWETCTMRTWLNSTFLNKAFNATEQAAIKDTTVVNEDNPEYGTEGGNNTTDKIYLLSISEVLNPGYGFTSTKNDTATRTAVNTAYVAAGGEIKSSGMYSAGRTDYWWLRSAGDYRSSASYVYSDGYVGQYGSYVYYISYAVRPALHLNLSSTSVWSYVGKVTSEGGEKLKPTLTPGVDYGSPTSSTCRMIPLFSTYKNKLDSFYRYHSFFFRGLEAEQALNGTSFAIPGLSTTNTIEDTGTGSRYLNNDTYVPQGICRMGDYILISAYQESYKGIKKDGGQDWRADQDSVIYVLDGSSFQYLATLVLPNKYHNGGIAFDGDNVWLTNTKGVQEVYSIKKAVVESKIAEIGSGGPYSARIRESEIGKSFSIQNKPSCLAWHDGKLWVAENGGAGKICGYTVTERTTADPVLTSYKCDTITTAAISGMKASAAKCINGIAFDGSDLYLSVSSGRQGAVKHVIRAKKTGSANIGSSYRVVKEVLVPDMSEELMIEGGTLYCVFESGANHYNGSYGKGPNIITERVLAFDKKLWED